MVDEQNRVRTLYRILLTLYPQAFKVQLGESMEQTFQDLWKEKRRKKKELFGSVLRTFIETATGIFREHLLLISPGDIMQTLVKTIGSPALISLLLILPLMIMEVVNRRDLNEEFPFMLFLVLWLNLFAISLILLPIWRGRRTGNRDMATPVLAQKNTLLTNPWSALAIGILLILIPVILLWLNSLSWLSLDRLFNGSNPEVAYLPGQVISLLLISIPIAAGIIAGRPIVKTLREGGSLFAHPLNLLIVAVISFLLAAGLVGLIVDQWPVLWVFPTAIDTNHYWPVISIAWNKGPGNCVLIGAMKKLIIGFFLFMTACQSATPTPVAATPAPTETPSPSPIPPTDTPSPTPTLAPTATPFPMFFTDEFDSLSTAWTNLQAGSDAVPSIAVENSRLSIQTDAPYAWVYSIYGPQEYRDVRLDTKLVNNALSPASAGLICRYSETDGWLEYNVTSDGSYNLLYGKWLASGVADYLPIVDGVSNAVPQSGMELQIGLLCSGTTATLLINDTVIRNADVSRFELATGKVGLAASSYENTPVIVSFDWFKVNEP